MHRWKNFTMVALFVAALGLAGCGGGGTTDTTDAELNVVMVS